MTCTAGADPGGFRVPNQVISAAPVATKESRKDGSQPTQGTSPTNPVTNINKKEPNPVVMAGAQD